jgi:hypothetical protein
MASSNEGNACSALTTCVKTMFLYFPPRFRIVVVFRHIWSSTHASSTNIRQNRVPCWAEGVPLRYSQRVTPVARCGQKRQKARYCSPAGQGTKVV